MPQNRSRVRRVTADLRPWEGSPSFYSHHPGCPPVAHILLEFLPESMECCERWQGGRTMARCLRSLVLGIMAGLGLLLPLQPGEAYVVTQTLTQTPVTGRLAGGGTFHGRLTIQTLTVDE